MNYNSLSVDMIEHRSFRIGLPLSRSVVASIRNSQCKPSQKKQTVLRQQLQLQQTTATHSNEQQSCFSSEAKGQVQGIRCPGCPGNFFLDANSQAGYYMMPKKAETADSHSSGPSSKAVDHTKKTTHGPLKPRSSSWA